MPTIPTGTKTIDLSEQAAQMAQEQPAPTWGTRLRNAWDALQGKRFGPGVPISPIISPEKPPEAPRQFQYPVSVNTLLTPRQEYSTLTPFEQLINLAELYDVAAMCIAARIEEMQGLTWSVAAKDKKAQASLQDECDAVTEFFYKPDKVNDFPAWIGMLLYDLYTLDALTLYQHPDQAGRLYSLDPVDGSTIKPLLDERGRTVAYQQIIWGFPESNYRRDVEVIGQYGTNELMYRPRWTRARTPYGFPPTEWIILRVNMALRKQSADLAWFTDGNIPDMIANPPDGTLNPDQVDAFEAHFNAVLAGDARARRKVRFVPWKFDFHELRPFSYETALDEWMLRVTCAAYSVPPQELGFTYDVNRATAEMQEAVNERRGTKPLSSWMKTTIFDPAIREIGNGWTKPDDNHSISYPGRATQIVRSPFSRIEWQWHFGDREDILTQSQSDQAYWVMGVVSADELRTMRFGDTLDGAAPGAPAMNTALAAPFGAPSEAMAPSGQAAAMGAAAAKFFQGGY